MRLIINVPDDAFDAALAVVARERVDYARLYDKPGFGWTHHEGGRRFFVRGIKGGISVRLSPTYEAQAIQAEADARRGG